MEWDELFTYLQVNVFSRPIRRLLLTVCWEMSFSLPVKSATAMRVYTRIQPCIDRDAYLERVL